MQQRHLLTRRVVVEQGGAKSKAKEAVVDHPQVLIVAELYSIDMRMVGASL